MKIKAYLKVAKTPKGFKFEIKRKPCYKALNNGEGRYMNTKYYPTVLVKINLDISDKEFDAAKNELDLKIESATPAIEISQENLE
jgi:hypothetical protein